MAGIFLNTYMGSLIKYSQQYQEMGAISKGHRG